MLANRHADGCLEKLARSLSQLGHSVYLTGSLASASATEGSFEALRHKFLTVITNGEEFIVDPTFREQFRVQDPTPRFEDMLESVPQVAVAPLSHVLEVVAHIASEMWMCFESKEIPLPPWRRMRSLLSKWEGSKKMRLLTHLDIVDDQISSAENSADYPPKNLFSNLSPSSVIF